MVQLPGREGRLRERAYTRMESAVEAIVPAVAALDDLPLRIFWPQHGRADCLCHHSSCAAPRCRRAHAGTAHCFGPPRPQPGGPEPDIHTLADGPFVGALIRRYNAIPHVLLEDVELLRLFCPHSAPIWNCWKPTPIHPPPRSPAPMLALGGNDDKPPRAWPIWPAGGRRPAAPSTRSSSPAAISTSTPRDALIETLVTAIGEAITALPNAGARPDPGAAPLQRSRT